MTSSTSQGPLVVIAGGSSAAGIAVAASLVAAGMRVVTVGSDAGRITAAANLTGGAVPLSCDLADPDAVSALVAQIHTDFGPVDGLVHLVGGWRGGGGITAQSDADWDFLHTSVLSTLRNTTRALYEDLVASPGGRLAIVSSTSVTAPTAGNASYASIKAAAETWVQSVAQGFSSSATPEQSAAVVLVVKALVDDTMRARSPERSFPGFTDVAVLAQAVTSLFGKPGLNGARIIL
ncbi:oxidoreductase [Arthrobacter alpinus]|uniref:SDR family oxidoreductase n=1 Tax=Arthrobacter alpinus TaxID=656366 RepID=UPI0005CB5804|nr:SDR family oxidoreductase [Arthrobacter alpinus]ALV45412.1 oxidoreductase [Arthrobacter alpinus]